MLTKAAILAALNKFCKWFFRQEPGKAVETINKNRLVQVRNPRSGKWQVIDRGKGEIIGTADEPEKGIEVVE